MKTNNRKKSVVCFGEVLWDNLPDGRKPGGAPMNVAYHLHQLGVDSQLISRVGKDSSGEDLIGFMKEISLPVNGIQIDEVYDTSVVQATVDPETQEVSYEIVFPVAWDFINWLPEFEPLLDEADAFVFGSLSARNTVSRETLYKMLEYGSYHIFDVNLRAPHFETDVIDHLLKKANMVKLNSSELMQIAGWYNGNCRTEIDAIDTLFNRFKMEEMVITKGSKGATYYTPNYRYDYPAYPAIVADTIGSGDSFLAAFLAMKLSNDSIEATLDYAVAMGAFITAKPGACPPYSKYDFSRYIWKKKLNIE
ncbi:carbohydrate kinase family protein [Pedobacter sp.]|uniref:carbohydrate kinase family protein n=1 Tax=Pedobacter sp. TaxID=1411316 RepID=UPI003D7F1BEE